MKQFIIVGDTAEHEGCLVYLCGRDKESAERTLIRMKNSPNKEDERIMEKHFNLRVEEVESGWWDDPFLLN